MGTNRRVASAGNQILPAVRHRTQAASAYLHPHAFPRLSTCFRTSLLGVLLLATSTSSHAEDAPLEKTDLFKGGENGFALYRIPGIVVTTKGSVLASCEARSDAKSDWVKSKSSYGAAPRPRKLRNPPVRSPISANVSPATRAKRLAAKTNRPSITPSPLWITKPARFTYLYCVNYARCFYMKSEDDGVSSL